MGDGSTKKRRNQGLFALITSPSEERTDANMIKIKQVIRFLNSIRKHWGSLVTSGSIIGSLSIWQGTGHSVWSWTYWVVAIGGLAIACFQTWEDQDRHINEEGHRAEFIQNELQQLRTRLNQPHIGTEFWLEERKPASHVSRYYLLGKIYNEGETVSEINGEMSFQPDSYNEKQVIRIQRQHLSKSSPIELEARELPGQAITDRIRMRSPLKIPLQVRFAYVSGTGDKHIYEGRYEYIALNRQFILIEGAAGGTGEAAPS
jgi:hypothetical protein